MVAMSARSQIILALFLAASSFARTALADHIIYVNASAAGANNGTSWPDAYTDLQDALTEAETMNSEPCEIWVAVGTYKPDRGTGDPWASFDLPDRVALYGGFVGSEQLREVRNWLSNETILSGDLLGNDDPNNIPSSTCCYPSLGEGCDDAICTEAVTSIVNPAPPCELYWHSFCSVAAQSLCCNLCRPTKCDNSSTIIKAINLSEGAIVDGFTIEGGEIKCAEIGECSPRASGFDIQHSKITVRNCHFTNNAGAWALHADQSQIELENSTFFSNDDERWPFTAVGMSGGIFGPISNISDCIFEGQSGGGLAFTVSGLIRRSEFNDNQTALIVGGSGNNALVESCIFRDHTGNQTVQATGTVSFESCGFFGNQSDRVLRNFQGVISVSNCVFSGNTGTAISNDLAMSIRNCSIHGNVNPQGITGGISNSGSLTLRNSVIWGNSGNEPHSVLQAQVRDVNDGVSARYFNSIEGLSSEADKTGNVGLDPIFVDAYGPDEMKGTVDDNLRLSSESPLINMGQPEPISSTPQDADGHARKLCGRVDMGAYEFGIGDYNCDRVVELTDFAQFPLCLTGPAPIAPYESACAAYDYVTEVIEDVDLLDFAGLQRSGFDMP